MVLVFAWILFSIVVAILGSNRKVGVAMLFLVSLFFSPLCGLILVMLTDTKPRRIGIVENTRAQLQLDELAKLKSNLDSGEITIEEFQVLTKKILTLETPDIALNKD